MADFFFLAPEIVLPFSPLTNEQFNKIKYEAEASWKSESRWSDRCPTTYGAHYRSKKLDEPPRILTFSETRLHNPQSHKLFLTNKIHYLPGYYNAKEPEPPKKDKGPELTTFFKDSMHVNHRVMHQVLGAEVCLPPQQKRFDIRARSSIYESPKSFFSRRRSYSSQTLSEQKWSSSSDSSQNTVRKIHR